MPLFASNRIRVRNSLLVRNLSEGLRCSLLDVVHSPQKEGSAIKQHCAESLPRWGVSSSASQTRLTPRDCRRQAVRVIAPNAKSAAAPVEVFWPASLLRLERLPTTSLRSWHDC